MTCRILFSPINIAGVDIINRSVMAPMVLNRARDDGAMTDEFKNFYIARALGGVGLIVVGATYVHADGKGFKYQLGIDRDELVPGLRNFCDSMPEPCNVFLQLSLRFRTRTPRDFTTEDIDFFAAQYGLGAARAKEAGFHGVELHACHDYFLNNFLSPYTNNRKDAYGEGIEGRMRLLLNTLDRVREAVGCDYPVGCRLSAEEFVPGGLILSESQKIARKLEGAGIDYLSVSGGIGETHYRMSPPMEVGRGSLLHLAAAIRKSVSVPVIGVGRLDRAETFCEAVADGSADMAAVGRALIADPDYVRKIEEGRVGEIRPCIACNHCLICLHGNEAVQCAVNPYVGRDLARPAPLKDVRNVLVVGGGPGGLTAAAALARRGGRVTLAEKGVNLGGALNEAKVPPFKENIGDFVGFLAKEAKESGVDVRLGVTVDREFIEREQPTDLIIAWGAVPLMLDVPGLGEHHVMSARDILLMTGIPHGRYLVVGAGAVGLETTEYLAEAGREVDIIEMTDSIGSGLHPMRVKLILDRLDRHHVVLLKGVRLLAVKGGWAKVETAKGVNSLGPYDHIVLATGYRIDQEAIGRLLGKFPVTVIGDARSPRTICDATREGLDAAFALP